MGAMCDITGLKYDGRRFWCGDHRERAFGSTAIPFWANKSWVRHLSDSDSDSQPTFLHVHVLITQLGAQVSSVLLTERECCCFLELALIRHHFSDVEGLQHITDHTKFAWACLNPLTLCITLVSVVVATWGILYIFLFPIDNGRLCYANCICNYLISLCNTHAACIHVGYIFMLHIDSLYGGLSGSDWAGELETLFPHMQ